MTFADLCTWLETLPLAEYIGGTAWFPFLESIHVLAAVFVFGSILMVDLRLLNVAARAYSLTRMSQELVPWTWGAFVVAVVTGIGLFMPRAGGYAENAAMQIKFVLLALAGANMALFHFAVYRHIPAAEISTDSTGVAKLAGAASLLIWSGVLLAGRWVGHLI